MKNKMICFGGKQISENELIELLGFLSHKDQSMIYEYACGRRKKNLITFLHKKTEYKVNLLELAFAVKEGNHLLLYDNNKSLLLKVSRMALYQFDKILKDFENQEILFIYTSKAILFKRMFHGMAVSGRIRFKDINNHLRVSYDLPFGDKILRQISCWLKQIT